LSLNPRALETRMILRQKNRNQKRSDARRRRANKPLFPVAVERSYRAFLMRRVRLAKELLSDQLRPLFDQFSKQINEKSRSDQSDSDRFMNAVIAVERGFKRRQIPNQSAIRGQAKSVDRFATNQQQKQIDMFVSPERVARVGVSMRTPATAIRAAWIKENVDLIKSIDDRYFSDVRSIVREGFEEGLPTKRIRQLLESRYQVSRSRAQLIARDQIAKLNGQITKKRQEDAGVFRYRWSTVGDERVRATHQANNGKVFLWSDPPPITGHPGNDFQCRCVAEPILDD